MGYRHLVLFDGECPLCSKAVRWVIGIDKNKVFVFAPLEGTTAREVLSGPQKPLRSANSLVLVEDYQSTERRFWIRSRAILRICWLMGNWAVGWLCFLPGMIGDFLYKKVALHRHQFKFRKESMGPSERFLP